MNSNLRHANTDTPTPGPDWTQLSDSARLALVTETVATQMPAAGEALRIIAAKQDGQIIANLLTPMPADKRGSFLLDFEDFLKNSIDPALAVWLEALDDRNALRNLRGIEVKA